MSAVIKKSIPLALTFLIGLILIFEWFIPTDIGTSVGTGIRNFGIVVSAFAVMAAAVGLYLVEIRKILKNSPEKLWSIWTLIVVSVFILLGILSGSDSDNYQFIYESVLLPLGASMYGSISFYIAAASYRVLRFKGRQATVLLIPAMILILANTPMISSIWAGFQTVGNWIMTNITQPGYRGIMIGTALGTLAAGIRTLIGRETGWLGRKEADE